MSDQRFYLAIIEKGRDGFGVFFPDLPGCTSFGKTIEKAAENAYVAAQGHAAVSLQHGEELPSPRAPEEIPNDSDVKEAARVLIPVEVADEPVRVNVSLPASALAALDRAAKELSLTRSGAIAHLALAATATTARRGRKKPHPKRSRSR